MTPENTRINTDNVRICRTCEREYGREWNRQKAQKAREAGIRLCLLKTCQAGHEMTPENTREVPRKSGSYRVCLKCEAIRQAKKALEKKRPKPKPRNDALRMCRKGLHPMHGDNVLTLQTSHGPSRTCRACRLTYQRDRARLKAQGIKPELTRVKYGSIAEKVQAFIDVDGDCQCWRGPAVNGAPVVRCGTDTIFVRRFICEQNGRVIPPDHRVTVPPSCKPMCVRNEHIVIGTVSEIYALTGAHSAATRAKAAATMRRRHGAGREQFLREAYSYVPKLRAVLRRKTSNTADIEDLIQQTLVRCYIAWTENHQPIEKLRSFMITAALNGLIDLRHHGWRRYTRPWPMVSDDEEGEAEMEFSAPPESDPYLQLQIAEVQRLRMRIFKQRLYEIPERQRECLLLKLDGRSQKEIAQALQISENSVESHLHRAYETLRGPETQMWRLRNRRDSYYLESIVA